MSNINQIKFKIMVNRLLAFLTFAIIIAFSSCSNSGKSESENKDSVAVDNLTLISVADFDKKAAEFVDKEVKIEGTVSHICKHGGKKMFLFTPPNEDIMVEITSETSFSADIEGSDVVVKGIVREERVTAEEITEMEKNVTGTSCSTESKDKSQGEVKPTEDEIQNNKELVNYYKELLKDSGSDHISFYSLECKSFEEKK